MHFNSDDFNLAAFEAEYAREERDRERLDAMRPITRSCNACFRRAGRAKADASLRANCVPPLRTRNYN